MPRPFEDAPSPCATRYAWNRDPSWLTAAKHLSPRDAARAIGVDLESFERGLEGRVPITAKLASPIEAAGWPAAQIWMRMQVAYDLAQERLRLERDSSTARLSAREAESTVAAS